MRVDKCVVYTCICISRLIVDVIDIDTGKSICMCLMCLTHFLDAGAGLDGISDNGEPGYSDEDK